MDAASFSVEPLGRNGRIDAISEYKKLSAAEATGVYLLHWQCLVKMHSTDATVL